MARKPASFTSGMVRLVELLPPGGVRIAAALCLFSVPVAALSWSWDYLGLGHIVRGPTIFGWLWIVLAPLLIYGGSLAFSCFVRETPVLEPPLAHQHPPWSWWCALWVLARLGRQS